MTGISIRKAFLKKQAPKEIKRVDTYIKTDMYGKPLHNQKPHIHFKDKRALNLDGTWKHGRGEITKEQNEWIEQMIKILFY